jgi:immunoglobulin-binding protein 1
MSNEPLSLRGLFLKAEKAREELSSSYEPNSPTFQEKLSATIATYEECLKIAEQVSLFSPNETLEDISSTDLQYVENLVIYTDHSCSQSEHLLTHIPDTWR